VRVLHLDSGPTLRGGQLQVLRLLEGLDRLGIDQTLLARGQLQRHTGAGPLRLSKIYAHARKADVIHAHDAHSHTLAAILAPGRPLIVSRRVSFPVKTGVLSRLKYGRASRFLAVSEHVKQELLKVGIENSRIDVVYDGTDTADQEPLWGPPHDPPRVAILNSEDPLKRTRESEQACRLAGLTPVIHSNLAQSLANADYFVYLPSLEGFGSAILAAAAMKKPVVASAVGGIPEVIVDGETGLLTDGSVAQSAEALKRLARDNDLARSLAESAFSRIAERFSSDIMVNRTADIYRSIMDR
jgi:glycosyltransferase involved in cell wall biosynthesis